MRGGTSSRTGRSQQVEVGAGRAAGRALLAEGTGHAGAGAVLRASWGPDGTRFTGETLLGKREDVPSRAPRSSPVTAASRTDV